MTRLEVIKSEEIIKDPRLKEILVDEQGDIYYVNRIDWDKLYLEDNINEINSKSKSIFEKFIQNKDPRVDYLIEDSFKTENDLLSRIMKIVFNLNSDIKTDKDVLDELVKDKYLLDRLLDIGSGKIKNVKKVNIDNKRNIDNFKRKLDKQKGENEKLKKENDEIKLKMLELYKMVDLLDEKYKIEYRKLNNELELERERAAQNVQSDVAIRYSTDEDKSGIPFIIREDLKKIIPYLMESDRFSRNRIVMGGMEISVPATYEKEILDVMGENPNPAILVEFIFTRLPHLLPLILEHYR